MINWKVRFKNPVFWVQIVAIAALTLINGAGQSWENMTSWPLLLQTLGASMLNPVTVVAMVAAVWAAVNDPTTAGLTDSEQAMSYDEPREG